MLVDWFLKCQASLTLPLEAKVCFNNTIPQDHPASGLTLDSYPKVWLNLKYLCTTSLNAVCTSLLATYNLIYHRVPVPKVWRNFKPVSSFNSLLYEVYMKGSAKKVWGVVSDQPSEIFPFLLSTQPFVISLFFWVFPALSSTCLRFEGRGGYMTIYSQVTYFKCNRNHFVIAFKCLEVLTIIRIWIWWKVWKLFSVSPS